MSAWVAKALEKNGPIWLVVIIVVLMVGPTGIQRMFDRFFPPESTPQVQETSIDLSAQVAKLKRSTDYNFQKLATNDDTIIALLRELADHMNTAQLDQIRLDLRLSALERLRGTDLRNPADKPQ